MTRLAQRFFIHRELGDAGLEIVEEHSARGDLGKGVCVGEGAGCG
jgi:hypothetical protein